MDIHIRLARLLEQANKQIQASEQFIDANDSIFHKFVLTPNAEPQRLEQPPLSFRSDYTVFLESAQYRSLYENYSWALSHVSNYLLCQDPADSLSLEILDYVQFMSPTICEYLYRRQIVDRVIKVVQKVSEKAEVHIYGSCSTGLYLPQADIDLTIFGTQAPLPSYFVRQTPPSDTPTLAMLHSPNISSSFAPTPSRRILPSLTGASSLIGVALGIYHGSGASLPSATIHPHIEQITRDFSIQYLRGLESLIKQHPQTFSSTTVDKARIPVMKHSDRVSLWNIDISLNGVNGVINSFIIRSCLDPTKTVESPMSINLLPLTAEPTQSSSEGVSEDGNEPVDESSSLFPPLSMNQTFKLQPRTNVSRASFSTSSLFYAARPLVIVLKSYLMKENLGDTYKGGMGSYLLTLLVISHIQMWKRNYMNDQEDQKSPKNLNRKPSLGKLLITFFHLYGQKFDFENHGISIRNGGFYFIKEEWREGLFDPNNPKHSSHPERPVSSPVNMMVMNPDQMSPPRPYSGKVQLCVEDPQRPDINVGKGCFNFSAVKQNFEQAYLYLSTPLPLHSRVWEAVRQDEERKEKQRSKSLSPSLSVQNSPGPSSDAETAQPPKKKHQIFSYSTVHPTADDWSVSGSERVPFHIQMRPTLLSRILKVDQSFRDWRDKLNNTIFKQVKTEFTELRKGRISPSNIESTHTSVVTPKTTPTTRFLSVHSPSFQPKGIQKMAPQMPKMAAGKSERREAEKHDKDSVPFTPIAAPPDVPPTNTPTNPSSPSSDSISSTGSRGSLSRHSSSSSRCASPLFKARTPPKPPLPKTPSQPTITKTASQTSLHPLTQAFVPSPSVNNSDLDSFLKSLVFSVQSSPFVWELQNADILFSDFFVSCTALPSSLPAGYISTQTNGSSPSGPTLSPRHAFDQLHDSFVGRGRGSEEDNRAAALLSSSGGFFAQPGTVNPQKASSSSSSQNRLHFSSAVNPYSLLDPSHPPLPPTPTKRHSPHPESSGSTQKHLPPHSFSALQLVNHPVLAPLLNTLIHSAYHSQQAQQSPSSSRLLQSPSTKRSSSRKSPFNPAIPSFTPRFSPSPSQTFATSPSSHTLPSPTLSRAHRTPSQPFFSDPYTTFGAIGPDQSQSQKRKPENEKPHTTQQTILGTASLEPSDIDDQHSKHVADSETVPKDRPKGETDVSPRLGSHIISPKPKLPVSMEYHNGKLEPSEPMPAIPTHPPSPPHSQTESATDAIMSPSTSRISVSMQWMCDSPFKPAPSVPFNEDELGLDDSDDDKSTPSLAGSRKEGDAMLSATTPPRPSSQAKSPNPTLLSANARPFVPSYSSSSFGYHPPQSVTPTFFPPPSPPPGSPFRKISAHDLQSLTQHEQNKIDERRRRKERRGEIDAVYGIWASQRGSISETRMPTVPVDRGQRRESDSSSATRGRKKPKLNRREKREQDEWMRWGGMDYNERHGEFGGGEADLVDEEENTLEKEERVFKEKGRGRGRTRLRGRGKKNKGKIEGGKGRGEEYPLEGDKKRGRPVQPPHADHPGMFDDPAEPKG
ncbi:putative non-canonical poly(A) RNA polymerase PAPD5/7 [Blattamonas nauphoetae]|uniref:Non-canonical poly(A) RNA polymerase PAPD5/7 n=1 Tax=Blattamonas nauphoetae TaxID=2049346 RepID=A0ABQ9XGJ8_9EUKA|nr:putative non-canonical poly(A) RNA polymerase PAPD5/7 [Blattamonas nauphoetae]